MKMEIIDIVDDRGCPTGETVGRDYAHKKGIRHRTAHVWIYERKNSSTRVLLQKRSQEKESFPGMYDTSSAGHIPSGDEPLNSAIRELKEELGISAKPEDLRFIGMLKTRYQRVFHDVLFSDNEVTFIYALEKKIDEKRLMLQKEEVDGVCWFDLDEVLSECICGSERFCVNPSSLETLKKYLDNNKS